MLDSINDYKRLFLFDKESKREMDKLKDQEEKDFKKFVISFTLPYIDEIKHILKSESLESSIVAECLRIVFSDIKEIQDSVNVIKSINLLEKVKDITNESIKRHLND
jgi:hypothetical protein